MDTLNLDYDVAGDFLYASFGPPVNSVVAPLPAGDVLLMIGADGTMVGFDIMGLSLAERRVPLIGGRALEGLKPRITPSTPWLNLRLRGDLLELWIDPERTIVARGLAATDGGDPLIVDLSPLRLPAGAPSY